MMACARHEFMPQFLALLMVRAYVRPATFAIFFLNTWLLKLECAPFDWYTQNHLQLPSTAFDDQHEQLSARCKTYMFYCAGGRPPQTKVEKNS